MTEPIKMNYVIGRYWEGTNAIGAYMLHSSEVHYNTLEKAKEELEYVKKQLPEKDWRIFQLIQVLT